MTTEFEITHSLPLSHFMKLVYLMRVIRPGLEAFSSGELHPEAHRAQASEGELRFSPELLIVSFNPRANQES